MCWFNTYQEKFIIIWLDFSDIFNKDSQMIFHAMPSQATHTSSKPMFLNEDYLAQVGRKIFDDKVIYTDINNHHKEDTHANQEQELADRVNSDNTCGYPAGRFRLTATIGANPSTPGLDADREARSVVAKAVWAETGVDEQLTGILDFGDGLTAHFDCGFNMTSRQRCLIAGTDGYLEIPNCFLPGNKKSSITEVRGSGNIKTHSFKGVNQYRLIAEDFMKSVTSGQPPYEIKDATDNMRVIEALINSAKNGGTPVVV